MVNEKMRQRLELSTLNLSCWCWVAREPPNSLVGFKTDEEGELQRRAAREARVDVVPPLQFVAFAELPAKQDHASVA